MTAVGGDIVSVFRHQVDGLARSASRLDEAMTSVANPHDYEYSAEVVSLLRAADRVGAAASLAAPGAVTPSAIDGLARLGDDAYHVASSQAVARQLFHPNAIDGHGELAQARRLVEETQAVVPTLTIADDATAVDLAPILARSGNDPWATTDLEGAVGQLQWERLGARVEGRVVK